MDGVRCIRPLCCSLSATCDLQAVREACHRVRGFLADAGLLAEELDAWELALTEAANNAVQYATDDGRKKPVRFDVAVHDTVVEVRLTDHTAGFDLPGEAQLPEWQAESGRGLFLIQRLTDEALYLRGARENCFVLRRNRRPVTTARPIEPNLPAELAETRRTLDLMTAELASAYESLATIFRFSAELPAGGRSEDFVRRWLGQLRTITESDWFVLRRSEAEDRRLTVAATSNDDWRSEPLSLATSAPEAGSIELAAATRLVDVAFDPQTPLMPEDPLAALGRDGCGFVHPMLINDALVGVLAIGRANGQRPFEAGQVSVIHTLADFLGIQIRNQQLQEDQARARLLGRELEIAAGIQRSLLPGNLPVVPGVALAAFWRSAREVGGDYYDVLPTGDGNVLLVVADVMGKGLPSALFSLMLRSLVRSRMDLAPTPGKFLAWLGRNLFAELEQAGMFVTAQLTFVDVRRRQLRVSAAGHPPLLQALPSGEIIASSAGGPPLGILADAAFPDEHLPWNAGCALMYTDGLFETRNPAGEFLGLPAVKSVLAQGAIRGRSCQEIRLGLVSLMQAFEQDAMPSDDTAFIILATAPPS